MVWKNGGGNSTSKHVSFESAKNEAQRLAAKHQDVIFYVLASEAWVKSPPPPVTVLWGNMVEVPDEDDIPFGK